MSTYLSTGTAATTSLFVAGLLGLTSALSAQASEHQKLVPGDGMAGDEFGSAVATDGTLVAIGAPKADELGSTSGSAYVFDVLGGVQLHELVALDGAAGDQFGSSIAVGGNRVVVGAPLADGVGPDSGAVYVFDATTGLQVLALEPDDAEAADQFGLALAMDGELVVVGSAGRGAYLFDISTGQQLEKLIPDGGLPIGGSGGVVIGGGFGQAVDIDADTGRIVVGAETANGVYSGSPYLFSGTAYLFDIEGNELHQLSAGFPSAWSYFGATVGIDSGTVAIGAPYADPNGKESGGAYLFDAVTGQQLENLVPSDGHVFQRYGSSVAVDGLHVLVGAEQDNGGGLFSSGSAYLYDAQSGGFVVKLRASDAAALDEFGGAVAAARGVLVSGAARDDDMGDASGSAYVFDAAGTVTDMAACFGNTGSLNRVGGLAVAGQTLVFRMESAQPGATLAMLVGSRSAVQGWPSCGVPLGSAGELLVDLSASRKFLTSSAAWTGSAADFSVAVPPMLGLVGFPFYVQGAFLAPASPPETVRLTGGLQVVLGGYL